MHPIGQPVEQKYLDNDIVPRRQSEITTWEQPREHPRHPHATAVAAGQELVECGVIPADPIEVFGVLRHGLPDGPSPEADDVE